MPIVAADDSHIVTSELTDIVYSGNNISCPECGTKFFDQEERFRIRQTLAFLACQIKDVY